ncbi:MAG TPA: dTMP kinase [Thermoflexia bacterium]|nr:dTMP kinase [Thermoflexia bacterium]
MARKRNRGFFITLEGPEGSGKSTQIPALAAWLRAQGLEVVQTREPGGTRIGEEIRALLHNPANIEMAPLTEILLYSASRAQHVAEVIRPALEAGQIVLCDRYCDSTYAYQGYGRGLALPVLREITQFATGGLTPNLTCYLDIKPELGLRRRQESAEEMNRLDRETLAFHRRVYAGYLALLAEEPERWVTVDAAQSIEQVQLDLRAILSNSLDLGSLREKVL